VMTPEPCPKCKGECCRHELGFRIEHMTYDQGIAEGERRANVDRWKDGYAAAERQIAAWLDQPCGMSGHDDRWCPACSFRADLANAIRDGKHRPANRKKP
jgi:hypothetical protein